MHLKIRHQTHYTYDAATAYVLQRLYLQPSEFAAQKVLSWTIDAPGMENALRYVDGFGNTVHLISSSSGDNDVTIVAHGEVMTEDAAGLVKGLSNPAPEVIFLRHTPVTQQSPAMNTFAQRFDAKAPVLERAHAIMDAVHGKVAYEVGTSHAYTTAAEAFSAGTGVCQDHAHIMIGLARSLGIPARYVTGYLVTGIGESSTAAHAWCELFVPDLGWVGFDAANGQCPTDHYVRIACGLDAAAVAPIKGFRRGAIGNEHMRVEVSVEIAQQ